MDCRRRWAVDDDRSRRKWVVYEDRRQIRWAVDEDRRRRRWTVEDDRHRKRLAVDEDRRRIRWAVDDDRHQRRMAVDNNRRREAPWVAQVSASLDRMDALCVNFMHSVEKIMSRSTTIPAQSPLCSAATPPLPLTPNPTSSASSLSFTNKPTQPSATDINFAEREKFTDSTSTFSSNQPAIIPRSSSITLDLDPSINICHHRPNDLQVPPVIPNPHILQIHDASSKKEDDDFFALGDRAKKGFQWHRRKRTDEMIHHNSRWCSSATICDQTCNPVLIQLLLSRDPMPRVELDLSQFDSNPASAPSCDHISQSHALTAEQVLNGSSFLIIKMVSAMGLKLAQASEVSVQKFLVRIYASFRLIEFAKFVFDSISNFNDASRNIMLGGYLKCDLLNDARQVFDDMPVKDLISWNVMINCFVQNNRFREALELFNMMLMEKMEPNESIYVNVFSICAHLDAVEQGKWVEKYLLKKDFTITEKNSMKWSAMMTRLAINNHAEDSLKMFSLMGLSGISPNEVNFIGLLNVYSHLKLVDEGVKYFKLTLMVYNNQPEVHHYCCLVDLYGRAGMLAKVKEVIKNMPMEPNSAVWGSLFNACKIYGNACLGEKVGKNGVIIEVLRDDCLRTIECFLLDSSRDPNFGEYGLAKLLPILDRYVRSSKTRSALGYMVSEFTCVTVKITKKCDVFEGMLLKTIAKRKPVEHVEDDVMILCYIFSGAMTEDSVEEWSSSYEKFNTILFTKDNLLKAVAKNIENKIFDPGVLISASAQSASTESRSFDARGV